MPKTTVSHRIDDDLLAWAGAYAKTREVTRSTVLEEALRHLKGMAEGGVPDLPKPAPAPRLGGKIVRASRLSGPSDVVAARQARLNRAKGD